VPEESDRLRILEVLLDEERLAPDVSVKEIASQTAALVADDLVNLVERVRLASLSRVMNSWYVGNISGLLSSYDEDYSSPILSEDDIRAAGVQLTAADFEDALSATRISFSESIGAPKIPNVTWDDVGGLESVKQDILDTVQLPLEHPELFADGLKKRSGKSCPS
jgi:peroxin-6